MVALKSCAGTILCRHTGEPIVCLFICCVCLVFLFFVPFFSFSLVPAFLLSFFPPLFTFFPYSVSSFLEVWLELGLYPLRRFILELPYYSFKVVISAFNRLLLHQRYPPVNMRSMDTQSSISGFLMKYS